MWVFEVFYSKLTSSYKTRQRYIFFVSVKLPDDRSNNVINNNNTSHANNNIYDGKARVSSLNSVVNVKKISQ